MADYFEKLKDPRWQRKRLEIMQRDGSKCHVCGKQSDSVEVHHQYYMMGVEPWDYPNESLICVCPGECHRIADRLRVRLQKRIGRLSHRRREALLRLLGCMKERRQERRQRVLAAAVSKRPHKTMFDDIVDPMERLKAVYAYKLEQSRQFCEDREEGAS